jgi:hypothetical protein
MQRRILRYGTLVRNLKAEFKLLYPGPVFFFIKLDVVARLAYLV